MREALLNICTAAVVCGIFRMLVPDKGTGSQVKLLISCFFIIAAANALSGIVGGDLLADIDLGGEYENGYVDFSRETQEMTAEETALRLKRIISEKLAEKNIYPEKIYIDINITDGESISISEVKLVFDRASYELYAERAVLEAGKCVGRDTRVSAEIIASQRERRAVRVG